MIRLYYVVVNNKKEKPSIMTNMSLAFFSVRLIGLEPTRRKTLDPKSSASTNFATGAFCGCKGNAFFLYMQIYLCFFYFSIVLIAYGHIQ